MQRIIRHRSGILLRKEAEKMPKALLDFLGYKFFFWSNENAEPPHVHVCRGKQTSNATKFWITADGIKL